MFGFQDYTELSKPRDLAKIFESAEYMKWRSFRDSEDSRFVSLVMPRVIARLPYGEKTKAMDVVKVWAVCGTSYCEDTPAGISAAALVALTVTATVKEKQAEGRKVTFACSCVNQDGATVLSGTAVVAAPAEKLRRPAIELAELHLQDHDHYEMLIERTKAIPPITCAVAHPCEESALEGAIDAACKGIIKPILVGPRARILDTATKAGLDIGGYELVDAAHSHDAAAKAVELVRAGKAELLMKGSLHSDEILGAVVDKEHGLRTARRISHVFIMDVPAYTETVFVTDAAINIAPDLDAKRDIIQNAVDLFNQAGFQTLPERKGHEQEDHGKTMKLTTTRDEWLRAMPDEDLLSNRKDARIEGMGAESLAGSTLASADAFGVAQRAKWIPIVRAMRIAAD